ncbi:hypothetical protein [Methylophilus sp. 3sh_L]|uniref:hypothetical protein n=1 Tax=Methylophilus sp. 3sh_L TaxID=3377114 RepID=UPI00398EE9F0
MDYITVLTHIDRLKSSIGVIGKGEQSARLRGIQAQIIEFMIQVVGPKSSFVRMAENAGGISEYYASILNSSLDSLRSHIEAGLLDEISPTRRAQLDVVSDFLEQAQLLLGAKGVHPAAPIVLIGASLEEFLRTWIDEADISLGQRKPSIDSYTQVLLAENLISKQDAKDITAWAGLRNQAAHGEWEEVSNKQRAYLMLEGVNLFMRKYSNPK